MTGSGSNGKRGRGFAGLDSMVSDISEDVEKAAKAPPPKQPPPEPPPADHPPQPARPEPPAAPAKSSPSGSGNSGLGWVIFGVIVLAIWIANSGSGNKSQPAPPYTPPPSYSSPAPAAPPPAPAPVAPTSDDQKPPEGRNNVLNIPQIRWCKREKIRIEAIANVINSAYDHEVDRFNARVSDYNSRCGEFRYRRGNVEQVDLELASEHAAIASKAKSEWVRGALGLESVPATTPILETPMALNKQATPPKQDLVTTMASLSHEERESIESACSDQKLLYGPAAYNKCLTQKLRHVKR